MVFANNPGMCKTDPLFKMQSILDVILARSRAGGKGSLVHFGLRGTDCFGATLINYSWVSQVTSVLDNVGTRCWHIIRNTSIQALLHVNNRDCSVMHKILQLYFNSLNIKHQNGGNYDLRDIVTESQPKKLINYKLRVQWDPILLPKIKW